MNAFGLLKAPPEAEPHGLIEPRPRGLSLVAVVVALAMMYALVGGLGLMLAAPPGYASAFWAPAGLSLAAMLLLGYRVWPGVLLGSFAVNCWVASEGIAAGDTRLLGAAMLIGVGASLQATLTALLLRRTLAFPAALETGVAVSRFLIIAGPLGCTVNATLGTLTLLGVGVLEPEQLLFNAWNWWVGDTIGVLIVTPLLLAWAARPGTVWRERRKLVTVPMLLAMAAVIVAFAVTRAGDTARIEAELSEQASNFEKSVDTGLRRTLDAVVSVRSFYNSSEFVSREEFQTFTSELLREHKEINALAWNAVVTAAGRASLEAEGRAAGIADYRLTERRPDGVLVDAAERPSHIIVHYIEPLAGNRAALGYDVASDRTRLGAFERARDTGEAVATERLWLVQSDRNVAGVLVIEPVYAKPLPRTLEERRARIGGYVVGVVVLNDLVAPSFADLRRRGLEPSIHDVTDGIDQRLDSAVPDASTTNIADIRSFVFGGRTWELRIAGGAVFAARNRSPSAWFVLAGGLALTSLLGAFLLLVASHGHCDRLRARRLRKEIERRQRFEADLHSEKERMEVTLQSIADGVISADAEGRVTFINRVGEMLTGCENGTALGQPLDQVVRLRRTADDDAEPDADTLAVTGGEWADDEIVLLSNDGCEYGIRYSRSPLLDREGNPVGTVTAFQDVTESRRMAMEVEYRANHDALTGLVNRAEFERRLERALGNVRRAKDTHVVFFMDLDQFKIVNDTAGHAAGDQLLREVSKLLHSEVRSRDTLGRLGGDEFGMLLESCPLERGVAIANTCVEKLREYRFSWEGDVFRIGVSIGVACIDGNSESLDSVMTRADAACYVAKNRGRNRVHVGRETGSATGRQELRRVAELRRVLDDQRLLLLYAQPIVPLAGGSEARFELLLHYRDGDGADRTPEDLVGTAERYGCRADIDHWLWREATSVYDEAFGAPTRIAIAIAATTFDSDEFVESVVSTLQSSSIAPGTVCFEIAEAAVLRDPEAAGCFMRKLREHGCEFALDDFGSGVSSLECLRNLPLDYLKIGGGQIRDIATDPLARGVVELIQQTARVFGLRTIAKQVPDKATLAVLAEIGVDFGQGPALGHPTSLAGEKEADPLPALPRYG